MTPPKALRRHMASPLPPGQFEAARFQRFGLGKFRTMPVPQGAPPQLAIGGDVARSLDIWERLAVLPRHEQVSDFHCVTGWSVRSVRWSGWRFADVHAIIAAVTAMPDAGAETVVFRGSDGYACSLPLADLMAGDVMLADTLDGQPLGLEHGGPLRLVAPAHYGYKSVKHLFGFEYWRDAGPHYRFPKPYPRFMDHPRARVAQEERALLPNWLIRPIYRLFVPGSIKRG
ncbi:molybdopterin-dependent oxidoreductase [Novosphingobium lentum]|uniref:molybdopterin-dependent oxidoreductase n=1 Tax=Novosphingobium lentum TaxID=145287 RepID=UPI000AEE9F91|nr:molybdopterin-dependent oxidoreductase [Novosphingobium lentum]